MAELPSIPEFYRNKNVFITGGSGFIGKVLIEKLLRSCPDIQGVILLMRDKKRRSFDERLHSITDSPLFAPLKSQQPEALSKIKVVNGDVTKIGLGLSPEDRQFLVDSVHVVFHGAASVRFDDALTDAVLLNTRGTRELVELALEMRNLEVLVHISTTYCHTDQEVVEEKLYPPHADWAKTIRIAEEMDRHDLNLLTHKYIQPLPNTYTFTKSLAEHVVNDLCEGKVPAVVFRPSVVVSSMSEPIPGWIDNFNGPVGLMVAMGKGIVRTMYSDPDISADYVPVDIIVKCMITASWIQATKRSQRLTPSFYNGSNNDIKPATGGQLQEMGKILCDKVPFNDILWYPHSEITKCYYNYFIKMIFFHFIPALVVDGLLRLIGTKPMLLRIQRRIYGANMALQYFCLNRWTFINEKTMGLRKLLLPSDVDAFSFTEDVEPFQFFLSATLGGRRYLLKEGDDTLDRAKRHSSRMWVASKLCNFLWDLALFWFIFVKIDIISVMTNMYGRWYLYFAE